MEERNIHRNLPLEEREAKVAIAKQRFLSNAYKQHTKKLNNEDPEAIKQKQQLFLKYAAKAAKGPTPSYETMWLNKSNQLYASDLEIIAKKLQHDNRETGLPITPDGPDMARKIEKSQNKYLNRQYKDLLKGIIKNKPADLKLQSAIHKEQKAFEASKPDLDTILRQEKNKYQLKYDHWPNSMLS